MRLLLGLALAALLVLPAASSLVPRGEPMAGHQATLYRDGFGVAHIYADSMPALFYANGYAQAQDRMFAMDALRHVGRGEAARFLGPGLLGSDFAAKRELYTEEQRLEKFLAMSPAAQEAFRAYVDGVNRALGEMLLGGNPPAEFVALNHVPEPWTVLDTVAVADFLLDRFGTGGGGEVGNAQLLAQLQDVLGPTAAEAAFHDAVWGVHATSYPTIPESEGSFQGPVSLPKAFGQLAPEQVAVRDAAMRARTFGEPDALLPSPGPKTSYLGRFDPWTDIKWGSNALLVAPSKSASGQALVGGGPQTGYFNPQVLYEVGLHGGGVDVVGVGVVGAPGVVLGRTGDFAWTVTSGISDQTDLVALPAAPDEERAYTWEGAPRALDCRTELHLGLTPPAIADTSDPAANLPQVFTQEVCESHLGPIVAWTQAQDGAPEWFFAAHKMHRGLEMAGAEQWLGIDSTTDLASFRQAFEGFPFTFNFNYAGPEGACYHHVGTQPLRPAALDPRFPTPPGDAWQWQGSFTGAQMPRICNPAQGYTANWNNLPQRGWPSGDSRELWGTTHRVQRLDAQMQAALASHPQGLTLDDVKDVLREAATRDSLAQPLILLLLPHAPPQAAQDLNAWLQANLPWRDQDNDGLYDDMGHAWYDAVRPILQQRILGDELGPFLREWNPDPSTSSDPHAADHGTHDNKDALLVDALSGTTGYAWCDDAGTGPLETCAQQVAAAFAQAGTPAPQPVHRTTFTPIGAGPAYQMAMTNRATYYHFHVGTDTGQSVSAIAPGQSGHLSLLDLADVVLNGGQGPVHMRDQLPLYEGFQFKPVPFTEAQAAALSGAPQVLVMP